MTAEEAIKNLESNHPAPATVEDSKYYQAEALGIEALKWYKGAKEDGCIRSDYFLPGETEE